MEPKPINHLRGVREEFTAAATSALSEHPEESRLGIARALPLIELIGDGLDCPDEDIYNDCCGTLINLLLVVGMDELTAKYRAYRTLFEKAADVSVKRLPQLLEQAITAREKSEKIVDKRAYSLTLLGAIIMKEEDPNVQDRIEAFFETHMDQLMDAMIQGDITITGLLANYIKKRPTKIDKFYTSFIKRSQMTPSSSYFPDLELFFDYEHVLDDMGKRMGKYMIKRYGFNASETNTIFNAWETLLYPTIDLYHLKKSYIYKDSLRVIMGIEQERPGIAKWLYRECNVRHFGRYPEELLIKAYDARGTSGKPQMVFAFPHADWNGAFEQDRVTLMETVRQTSSLYTFRIFETDSTEDLEHRFMKLFRAYGKIDAAIIGGHGHKDGIIFGNYHSHALHSNQSDRLRNIFRTCFRHGASVILFSCSTGKKNGLAQRISSYDIDVQGPDANAAPTHITIHPEDKAYRFVANYEGANTKRYFKGKEIK